MPAIQIWTEKPPRSCVERHDESFQCNKGRKTNSTLKLLRSMVRMILLSMKSQKKKAGEEQGELALVLLLDLKSQRLQPQVLSYNGKGIQFAQGILRGTTVSQHLL